MFNGNKDTILLWSTKHIYIYIYICLPKLLLTFWKAFTPTVLKKRKPMPLLPFQVPLLRKFPKNCWIQTIGLYDTSSCNNLLNNNKIIQKKGRFSLKGNNTYTHTNNMEAFHKHKFYEKREGQSFLKCHFNCNNSNNRQD